jgi:hypothetical protein
MWRIARVLLVIGLVTLFILRAASVVRAVIEAEIVSAPVFQDDDYPAPDTEVPYDDYPAPEDQSTETPFDTPPPPPAQTLTPTPTPTLAPDVFRTEDAEIGDSQVTPSTSETPGPTPTAINTPTPTVSYTATPEPTPVAVVEEESFRIDWGLFSIGFAIPVLIGCGIVLHYLDRRPDLFTPRRKDTL